MRYIVVVIGCAIGAAKVANEFASVFQSVQDEMRAKTSINVDINAAEATDLRIHPRWMPVEQAYFFASTSHKAAK